MTAEIDHWSSLPKLRSTSMLSTDLQRWKSRSIAMSAASAAIFPLSSDFQINS